MMRHPPSTCAKRVGQLLAYAAAKTREPKVFMQLLKTMKKPVDGYILGAYYYLTNGTNSSFTAHAIVPAAPGPASAIAAVSSNKPSQPVNEKVVNSNSATACASGDKNGSSNSSSGGNATKAGKKQHGKEKKEDNLE
uniref:Transcription activator MSS11 n=1 Tax=Lygus hesperus TaxID=30085 RepID=A0A0A9WSD4_LYGHE